METYQTLYKDRHNLCQWSCLLVLLTLHLGMLIINKSSLIFKISHYSCSFILPQLSFMGKLLHPYNLPALGTYNAHSTLTFHTRTANTHCRLSISRQSWPDSADCSSLKSGPALPLSRSLWNQASLCHPAEEKMLRTRAKGEREQSTRKPVQNHLCL